MHLPEFPFPAAEAPFFFGEGPGGTDGHALAAQLAIRFGEGLPKGGGYLGGETPEREIQYPPHLYLVAYPDAPAT